MTNVIRHLRRGTTALILGGMAGLATFAAAAVMDPLAGAAMRGLRGIGATPALVERTLHEETLDELASALRDLGRMRTERNRVKCRSG